MKVRRQLSSAIFTLFVLTAAYFMNLFFEVQFKTQTLIPMIFVLAVFIVSAKTTGYFWGASATVISVLAVNFCLHLFLRFDFRRHHACHRGYHEHHNSRG